MSTAALTSPLELKQLSITSSKVLKAAAIFWFVVAVIGQLLFAGTIGLTYGFTAARGNWQQWGRFTQHGIIPGDGMGNVTLAIHIFSAFIIILSGALQIVPQVRDYAPTFHHWNGRIYFVTAFTISLAGLYLLWVRGTVGDLAQHLGSTLMAVLIMLCAVMAVRYARARNFTTHRRWALRLYLVVSASLFIRAGFFLSFLLNRGPFGFDPSTFTGPFLTFMTFAQYLLPLAVLEMYFWAKENPGALGRLATAAVLFVLTLGMGAGILAVTVAVWARNVKAASDPRQSIAETLSATIASRGIDAAEQQYHDLKTAQANAQGSTQATTYNFDEVELNRLGYDLLRTKKFADAIRILQLNVEAYPNSSNVYDSLGEAYMDAAQKQLAILNYKKSLELNPKNTNGAQILAKLSAP
jgi:uncharacterized membrane protein